MVVNDIMVFLRIMDAQNFYDTQFRAPTSKLLAKTLMMYLLWSSSLHPMFTDSQGAHDHQTNWVKQAFLDIQGLD